MALISKNILKQRTKRILNLVDLTKKKIKVRFKNNHVYFNFDDISREINIKRSDYHITEFIAYFGDGGYISEIHLYALILLPINDKYPEFIAKLAYELLPQIISSGDYVRVNDTYDMSLLGNYQLKVEA